MSLSFNWQGQPFKADFEGLFKLEIISILLYVDDMAIMVDDEGELEHYIQGMHPVNPTLRVRVVGTQAGKLNVIQMGFLHKAIEGEVVVETEQCKSRNHMRH
ncbi:unnamed protein product [Sphagnum jensenii]|uniref:Reverse transcriptase Ty1/copia-type domain-containing protein n=1 Tax=Sphagnum jensenii TaxID=128206 RepID=A0ABP1BTN3_9BRYO